MYSYKPNNSYIVIVIPKKKCPSNSKASSHSSVYPANGKKAKLAERSLLQPLPVNSLVRHKLYGIGKVIGTDKYGYMTVSFASTTTRFVYPDAFKYGCLTRVQ